MELKKIFKSNRVEVEDGADSVFRMKLVDLTTTSSFVSFGEIRFDNSDGALDDKFKAEDEFEFYLGYIMDRADLPYKIFTGSIEAVEEGALLIVKVKGHGVKLQKKLFKASWNSIESNKVFRNLVNASGMTAEIDNIKSEIFHSLTMPEAPISEQILRANEYFSAGFVPWVTREGVLKLKTYSNAVKATSVVFNFDEFQKLEKGILETVCDPELDIFNQVKIGNLDYIIINHRFFLNEYKSKSFIALEKV